MSKDSRLTRRCRALAKGWGAGPVVVIFLATAAFLSLAPSYFGLPNVSSYRDVVAPVGAIAAWMVLMGVLTTAREPAFDIFLTSRRRAKVMNLARVTATTAAGALAISLLFGGPPLATFVSVATLVGEGLTLAYFTGLKLAWLVPTAHLASSISLGGVGRNGIAGWAWIVDPQPSLDSAALSALLLTVGLALWARRVDLR